MPADITYTKTNRGERAFIKQLPDAVGQVLTVMVANSTEEEIFAKLQNVNLQAFKNAMTWLLEGGFIKLMDAESFSNPNTIAPMADAIQVHEISIDEFTSSVTPTKEDEAEQPKIIENKAQLEAISNTLKEAKLKAETDAKKEQERLQAIEDAKLTIANKAKEVSLLKVEAEAKAKTEIDAKKEEWARLKTEAKEKEKAEIAARKAEQSKLKAAAEAKEKMAAKEKAETESRRKANIEAQKKEKTKAEEKIKAKKWAQLKQDAKEKAEEKTRLQKLAKAEAEVRQQRKVSNARSKNRIKNWFASLLQAIKSLFFFTAAVLCTLLIAAHFINIPMLVNPLEKIVSAHIHEAVTVQSVHVWLYPKPHLLLKDLTIDDSPAITAQKLRIYPNYINLKKKFYDHLTVPYVIQSLQVEGLTMAQEDLAHVSTWAKASLEQSQYQINKIILKNTALHLNSVQLPLLDGEALLNAAGLLTQASLQSAKEDFRLNAQHLNGNYLIDINANNWQAPFYPRPVFTKLDATGVIKNSVLTLSSITGSFSGGKLTGALETDLASPTFASKGDFNLSDFVIKDVSNDLELNKTLTGVLNSRGYFSFGFDHALNTIKNTKLNAAFTVKNGVLKRVDIAEAMRNHNLNGSTSFTRLTGNLSLNNKRYQLTKLSLQDSQLQASGQVSLSADKQVSATLSSNIAIPNNEINANLIIKGPLTALKLIN